MPSLVFGDLAGHLALRAGAYAMREITLQACERAFTIACRDERSAALVRLAFGGLVCERSTAPVVPRRYRVEARAGGTFQLFDGETAIHLPDANGLLFHLEKDLTLTLQRHRPDLFFLHGAAVSWCGLVVALAAPSGTGKSTLALASVEQGFDYLSDELAPIDLRGPRVHPYPCAICLKEPALPVVPPAPEEAVPGRLRVPVEALPKVAPAIPQPIGAVMFLRRDEDQPRERLRRVTPASAAVRLIENALNPLAHPGNGLDAAEALASCVPAFELDIREIGRAVDAVRGCVAGLRSRAANVRTPLTC